ncbi:hypothetical protein [Brevibacillus brevis]|uniref:Uncharacterized protein n=1 Tax=Brevibacillus brevis TaxID=1393 RepID=A0A517I4L5_BREBE|nr:hypothetical protein [Brevibacillus brevis]QDS33756.1 hypothetical protein FPS98_06965 [Brevibacillus brevis]
MFEWLLIFFNNSWVTSIITGLLVFYVTDIYKRLKEKKSYFQKVGQVNKEIFKTIKYSIPEEKLPSISILKSIHIATAKRYNVKLEDVDSLQAIIDDLIKEIMDSNFLSHDNKLLYCQRLLDTQNGLITKNIEETTTVKQYVTFTSTKSTTLSLMFSTATSMFAATIVFLLTTFKDNKFTEMFSTFIAENSLSLLNFALVIVALLISIMTFFTEEKQKRKMKREKKTKAID